MESKRTSQKQQARKRADALPSMRQIIPEGLIPFESDLPWLIAFAIERQEKARKPVTLEINLDEAKPEPARGPSSFTQAAITRAVKGVQATGAPVGKVEVTKDKITVEVGKADDANEARDASAVATDRIAALRRVK